LIYTWQRYGQEYSVFFSTHGVAYFSRQQLILCSNKIMFYVTSQYFIKLTSPTTEVHLFIMVHLSRQQSCSKPPVTIAIWVYTLHCQQYCFQVSAIFLAVT